MKYPITLSSIGLKNIVRNSNAKDNDFNFIFGKHEIKINIINAEFISPAVSKLHYSDPTISFIRFNECFKKNPNPYFDKLLTDDIISIFKSLANGEKVEIDKDQIFVMQMISILIGNDELFSILDKIFPININESNLDNYLVHMKFFYGLNNSYAYFNISTIIDYISSNFYTIDQRKLLKLPIPILYLIVRNPKLKLYNEDSFLHFINNIFKTKKNKNKEFQITDFYELVDFSALSESKFRDFISNFESSEITSIIWQKLIYCFYFNNISSLPKKKNSVRYFKSEENKPKTRFQNNFQQFYPNSSNLQNFRAFLFDGDDENSFRGIIHNLTIISGGNVNENGIVEVTASSNSCRGHEPKNVVDFDNYTSYFACNSEEPNQWLMYDFKELKVKPTHYSIRSRSSGSKGFFHLKNWVIEGSNTGSDEDWTILDSRNSVTCLDGKSLYHTFEISAQPNTNLFYRYLRLRQTDVNTGGKHSLRLSALEFFGYTKS